MDAAESPVPGRAADRAFLVRIAVVGTLLLVGVGAFAAQQFGNTPPPPPPGPAANPLERLLPAGPGLRDPNNPDWSIDPADPFPMPPHLAGVELMKQTADEARAKSAGCVACHAGIGDPHQKDTLRLGCTDCHGGDATTTRKELAHVPPRNPQFWPTSANPVRSYTLLNNESPDFIRFVNPGDFRVAHMGCGTAGCHPREVQTNRKQIMATGCMLWGRPFTTTARCRTSGPGSAKPTG